MTDTKGVFSRQADVSWKLMVLVAAIAVASVEGYRFVIGEARGDTPPHSSRQLDAMANDIREMKAEQARQGAELSNGTRDIAVIKRQLGLDGLGGPPVRASGLGR